MAKPDGDIGDRARHAVSVFNELTRLGLPPGLAHELIGAVGPRMASRALDWALNIKLTCSGHLDAKDAARIVFSGLPRDFGVRQHLDALSRLGFSPTPYAMGMRDEKLSDLKLLIKGVKEVLLEWAIREDPLIGEEL